MHALLLLATLTATPIQFEGRILGDQVVAGTLAELGANRLAIATKDGLVGLDADKLIRLTPQTKPAPLQFEPKVWVDLVDGSTFPALDYTASGGRAKINLPGDQPLELPVTMIATVRLQPETETLGADWQRILAMKLDGDVLVARKGESLDYHKGLVRDVTDQVVEFVLDGDTLPVKRSKVYGLAYYRSADRQMPEETARLIDNAGATWSVRSLSLAGDKLQWSTPTGLTVARPLSAVAQIDFSAGKILYLSDLKPDSIQWSPYFGTDKTLAILGQFFAPRHDKNLESKPLQLGGVQYGKGLALHSRTDVVYRLPERYSRFKAVVGIDDSVRPHGNVRLVIRGDDRVLFEATLTGSDAPKPVDLDLKGVRRLGILVDFGAETDVGDHLDLADAMIIK